MLKMKYFSRKYLSGCMILLTTSKVCLRLNLALHILPKTILGTIPVSMSYIQLSRD